MRLDAYAGNVRAEASFSEVAEVLGWSLGGLVTRGRPVRRYGEVLKVEHAGRTAVWVGRDVGNQLIYFEGKGETSPEVAAAVRKHFPGHTVSRADVCEDYDEEGAFERLVSICRHYKGDRTYGGFVKVSDDPGDGRTYEVAKRTSLVYGRVYQAGLMKERMHLGRPHWTRAEFECKPHYAKDKARAATMAPVEFLGMSGWSKRVGEALTHVEIPRYAPEHDAPTFERTQVYLARVFRRHWEEALSEGRDWTCIGKEFEEVWRVDDEAREAFSKRRGSGS
jgi:hypothetical protein